VNEVVTRGRLRKMARETVDETRADDTVKPLKLLVLAHANRAAGGRSVGLNILQALAECSIGPDAILALGNVGIVNPSVFQSVLVHDPHLVYPRAHYGRETMFRNIRHAVQRWRFAHCICSATLIYCQTETMLRRLQQIYRRVDGIKLLPNCVPSAAFELPQDRPIPKQLAAYSKQFRLICLTRYYAHKNLESIVDTFQSHKALLKDVVVFLTIVPEQDSQTQRLLKAVHRLGLSDRIVNLGPIEQRDVPAYFRYCHGLLLPTKLESFSTTYLEAMQCGLPILTSDLDFAREVCGEAALYFDPWSSKSMAEVIALLRDDTVLGEHLVEQGRRRIALVHGRSWNDVAQSILTDMRKMVQGKKIVGECDLR